MRESGDDLSAVFLERKERFRWHPGMLLPGTTMQISFLKDLATLRNPSSTFSFVAYLGEKGRIVDFVNRATLTPERAEFADYLAWAAGRFDESVRYGREAVDVIEAGDDAPPHARFAVLHRDVNDGSVQRIWARNVVVARGLEPLVPEWAQPNSPSGRVFHAIETLDRIDAIRASVPGGLSEGRFLVVGGGQSAAEVAAFLHDQGATVDLVFRGFGLGAVDESPFVNQVFDPDAVDEFHGAPTHVGEELLRRHANTNYGAVEHALADDLFARWYREGVSGERRLRVRRTSVVTECVPDGDSRLRVTVDRTTSSEGFTESYDAVVCATGFRPSALHGFDGLLGDADEVRVSRAHRAVVDGAEIKGLYVQGADLRGHGLATTLLSNVAVRSGELVRELREEPRS